MYYRRIDPRKHVASRSEYRICSDFWQRHYHKFYVNLLLKANIDSPLLRPFTSLSTISSSLLPLTISIFDSGIQNLFHTPSHKHIVLILQGLKCNLLSLMQWSSLDPLQLLHKFTFQRIIVGIGPRAMFLKGLCNANLKVKTSSTYLTGDFGTW